MADPPARGCAPRIIWSLWLQGPEEAPELVRLCLDSWRRQNPGWELRLLDRAALEREVDLEAMLGPNLAAATPQTISDAARVALLARHGGVWSDATVLCRRPLDEWLWARMASGFFAFAAPGPDRLVSTWFLAAAPANPLMAALDSAVSAYWSRRLFRNERHPRLAKRLGRLLGWSRFSAQLWLSAPVRDGLRLHPYFWLHYLLAETIAHDPGSAAIWAATETLPASGPHALQRHGLDRPPDAALRAEIEGRLQPLYKLDLRSAALARGKGGVMDLVIADA